MTADDVSRAFQAAYRAVEVVLVPFTGGGRTLFRIPLGSGIAPLRRIPGLRNRT